MESSTGTTRRFCFTEEDDGLASIAQPETAGFSGNTTTTTTNSSSSNSNRIPPPFSRPLYSVSSQRRGSFRSLSFSSMGSVSPRFGGRFYDGRFEDLQPPPHFLDACSLCKKPIGENKDIFMYRGDTPFCSEECRQEQIERDEAKEKDWNISSMKKLRKKDQSKSSTSPNRAQQSPIRPGTVVAA